ncbi:hypothetical protein [Neptuniibacter sp.]|uniref:hypothetical protein n=1 Tax=Neptuniibacter sp. TaxID=1962643 RepID=UPI002623169A|nr:hypothetical protein [Neptuniibacter sp.]MCP4597507.1 ceramidase [Neptuniibacter sp.]
MKGCQIYKFSGAFYLKAAAFTVAGWVMINLIFGNSPLGGHYYIPVVLLIYLLVQLTYKVDLRKDALHIKRFGMGAKVSFENLHKVEEENGTIGLHVQDGRQYNIPLSRFTRQDQKQLSDQLNELWAVARSDMPVEKDRSDSDIPDYLAKEEAKKRVVEMLGSGVPKKEVFEQLKDRGIRDNKLAMMIASVPDELLCILHEGKNNILVIVYSLLAILAIWGTYMTAPDNIRTFSLVILIVTNLLFIWGFFSFKLIAYNVFIFLSLVTIPKDAVAVIAANDIPGMVGIGLSVLVLAYVWFIRSRLYPDIGFIGVKKDKAGQYQFSE